MVASAQISEAEANLFLLNNTSKVLMLEILDLQN
jgi:hypothetical protein